MENNGPKGNISEYGLLSSVIAIYVDGKWFEVSDYITEYKEFRAVLVHRDREKKVSGYSAVSGPVSSVLMKKHKFVGA